MIRRAGEPNRSTPMTQSKSIPLLLLAVLAAIAVVAVWRTDPNDEPGPIPQRSRDAAESRDPTDPTQLRPADVEDDLARNPAEENVEDDPSEGSGTLTQSTSRTGTLFGRITGIPAHRLRVSASFRRRSEGGIERRVLEADATLDGDYRIDGIVEGAIITLEVRRDRAQLWEAPFPIRLSREEEKRVDIEIEPGHSVAGTLYTPAGLPRPDEELWLRRRTTTAPVRIEGPSPPARTIVTAADGTFRIDDLQKGRWAIGLAPDEGEATATGEPAIAVKTVYFSVGPDEATDPIELVAHTALEIHGRVVDEDGRPRMARLTASVPHNPHYPSRSTTSEGDGRFTIGPLLPHTYTISATTEDGAEGSGTARPVDRLDAEPLEIVLEAREP